MSPQTSHPVFCLSIRFVVGVTGSEKLAMNFSVKSAGSGCGNSTLRRSGFDVFWRRRHSSDPLHVVRILMKCSIFVKASMA